MNQNLRKVLQYALTSIYNSLKEKQSQMILIERFGDDAVCNPIFHSVTDTEKNKALWGDVKNEYLELMELASNIEKILKVDDERAWQEIVDSFFNQNLKK